MSIVSVKTEIGIEEIDLDTIDLTGYKELLSRLSVDTGLPDDAKTLLYSGNIHVYDEVISSLDVVKGVEGVRIIRDTDLGKFVESKSGLKIVKAAIRHELENGTFVLNEFEAQLKWKVGVEGYGKLLEQVKHYSQLSADEMRELLETLTDGYLYDAQNGAWATASKVFITKIPPTSEVICICPEAGIEQGNMRIWAAAEIPEALDSLSDGHIFGGYTIAELRQIRDTQGMDVVFSLLKDKAVEATSDIKVYFDTDGNVLAVDASYLGTGSKLTIPDNATVATLSDIRSDMSSNETINGTLPDGSDGKTGEVDTNPDGSETETGDADTTPDGDKTETGDADTTPDGDKTETGDADTTPDGDKTETGDADTTPDGNKAETDTTPDGSETGETDITPDRNRTETGENGNTTNGTKTETGETGTTTNGTKTETGETGTTTNGTKTETGGTGTTTSGTKTETGGTGTTTSGTKTEIGGTGNTTNGTKVETGDAGTKTNGTETGKSNMGNTQPENVLTEDSVKLLDDFEKKSGIDVESYLEDADIPKVNKMTKVLKVVDVLGDAADVVDAAVAIGTAKQLFDDGNVNEGSKVLRDYGFETLGGTIASVLATAAVGTVVTNPVVLILAAVVGGIVGTTAGGNFSDWLDDVLDLYDEAGAYCIPVDPLILDLDGDGAESVSAEDGVYFDFDNNGFAEKIGWVNADDGLLVRDINRNGIIDNGSELMGDLTQLDDGTNAQNGFEALASFDLNGDGIIDNQDAIFSELRIWIDKNQNGITDTGELNNLSELGIEGINVNYNTVAAKMENGNTYTQKGSYIKSDGSVGEMVDVWFSKNAEDTLVTNKDNVLLDETEEIMKLPNIAGIGNLYSLHQAMLRNKQLQELVTTYVNEENYAARKNMVREIIYVWTGVNEMDSTGRGKGISDARMLEALEVFSGREFESRYGSNPISHAGVLLEQAFGKMENLIFAQLEMQSSCLELLVSLVSDVDLDESGKVYFGTKSVMEKITQVCNEDPDAGKELIGSFVSNLMSIGMIDDIDYTSFCCGLEELGEEYIRIVHNIGDDTMYGSDQNDTFNGEMGDDIIFSGSGENYITGDSGNDILIGENGSNTYFFSKHDGTDIILNHRTKKTEELSKIVFDENVEVKDISLSKVGTSLYIRNESSGDLVVVWNHFMEDDLYCVDTIEFADGTVWNTDKIDRLSSKLSVLKFVSTAGTGSGVVITYITPEQAEIDDTFISTAENEQFSGSIGVDTYIFNNDSGNDTINNYDVTVTRYLDKIVFDSSVSSSDIDMLREGDNLLLKNESSGDTVTIRNYFSSQYYAIENIEFADGTIWHLDEINEHTKYINGTENKDSLGGYSSAYGYDENEFFYAGAGNDTINALEGADFLDGGIGDDVLKGGSGNDTYFFRLGDGNDSVEETGGLDRFIFDAGVSPEDIIVSRDNRHLYLNNQKSGEKIKISNFWSQSSYFVEFIEFADGTLWEVDTLKDKARYYYGTDANEVLTDYDQGNVVTNEDAYMYGGAGNDTLWGLKGADSLYGEDGNDSLNGGNDNDFLSGGTGNDSLNGDAGDDVLYGGLGNDRLNGGTGNNTYYFNAGDGQDDIYANATGVDRVVFGEDVKPEDILITRDVGTLYLKNTVSGDCIKVRDFYRQASYKLESVEFADGTVWDAETIKDKARYYYGTDANEVLTDYDQGNVVTNEDAYMYGGAGNDTLWGLKGADSLYGEDGNDSLNGGNDNDFLSGGAGNDSLNGDAGDDVLYGGLGDDKLYGGNGDDTYYFNNGDGQDTISDNGSGNDTIILGEGICAQDIKFSKVGNNLQIDLIDSDDQIIIKNHFVGEGNQIETFRTDDGLSIDYTKIELMIQAMASFEDNTGMMWEEAIEAKNETANDIVNQWWTKDAI